MLADVGGWCGRSVRSASWSLLTLEEVRTHRAGGAYWRAHVEGREVHERVLLEKQRSVEEDWKSQEVLPKDQDRSFSKKASALNLSQATSPEEAPF